MSRRKARVRQMRAEDIPAVIDVEAAAYCDYPPAAISDRRLLELRRATFPEGQLVAEVDGRIVGYANSLIVQLDGMPHEYTYREITGAGTFSTHDPGGDTLYGADIAVHPEFRGQGISIKLYEGRMRTMRRYNLRRMLAFGRIPGYAAHAGRMTAREYVDKVVAGELSDPALRAHLKAGYRVLSVRLDYMDDASSQNYSTLLQLDNPGFAQGRRRIAGSPIQRPVRKVRVCAAQWRMRHGATRQQFERTVAFFAETADAYHCHFLVLPEMFVAQLFTTMPEGITPREGVERLADESHRYRELLSDLARRHQLYIVGGSHPMRREGKLYNVGHLFSPTGGIYEQDKLHITPAEREHWGIHPGEAIRVFETPLGRISVLVCYDLEFPELGRLVTLAGAQVIFVPFSTDERRAYDRVRFSAHARAVENSVYVVLSGNAGNLPMRTYLINYARSAIVTPSDFGFPEGAVAAEADANVETVVTADLDFAALDQHRELGSVRLLHDRRPDLYELRPRTRVEVVVAE
jgi:predicted amidohydrolase/ribosomal protein S18 acetylase RimI-like enzyme